MMERGYVSLCFVSYVPTCSHYWYVQDLNPDCTAHYCIKS
uniref:Uncharacterized protein n=1 Tax=Anguilla anguilla TaxID=7936 RepID=A0A0E9UZ45_ANGAN